MSQNINVGSIVRCNPRGRCWVVLEVTEEMLEDGINAEGIGLYGFGGLWYGEDPLDQENYGKITPLDETFASVGRVEDFEVEQIREMVN